MIGICAELSSKSGVQWQTILERGITMNERDLENWEPDEDMIEWAQRFFDSIPLGGIWSPEGSGVSYKKISEYAWSILRMMEHPIATAHHTNFKKLFAAIDVEIMDDSGSENGS